ncbi:MAG: hypothetical protein IPF56_10265 [Chloroflexi bacterium]|nr:hypothetical protein [Chloroflexota bacterium]
MRRQFINRNTIGEDLTAGLVLGIQSIPDGLAKRPAGADQSHLRPVWLHDGHI